MWGVFVSHIKKFVHGYDVKFFNSDCNSDRSILIYVVHRKLYYLH
jgi:hypothetical protein